MRNSDSMVSLPDNMSLTWQLVHIYNKVATVLIQSVLLLISQEEILQLLPF